MIKDIYAEPNIVVNDGKLNTFPLSSSIKQGCPLSPLAFQHCIGVLANKIRQENIYVRTYINIIKQ